MFFLLQPLAFFFCLNHDLLAFPTYLSYASWDYTSYRSKHLSLESLQLCIILNRIRTFRTVMPNSQATAFVCFIHLSPAAPLAYLSLLRPTFSNIYRIRHILAFQRTILKALNLQIFNTFSSMYFWQEYQTSREICFDLTKLMSLHNQLSSDSSWYGLILLSQLVNGNKLKRGSLAMLFSCNVWVKLEESGTRMNHGPTIFFGRFENSLQKLLTPLFTQQKYSF